MKNYIRDLLKEKDRVIIPNLGGFLKSKGEINNLIFNEFIKFNDGQLINYVAKREDIGIDDASEKVDQFVESSKEKLNKGKKIKIDDVGTLFMGERGRLRFNAESAENQSGAEPASTSSKEEPKEKKAVATSDPGKEEKPSEKKETPVRKPSEQEKEAAEKEIIEETQSPEDTGDGLAEKPPVPVPDEKEEKTASVDEVSEKKEAKPTAPAPEKKPAQAKERIPQKDPRGIPPGAEKPEKEQKRRSPLLWLIPLIILIALGVWIILDYDNIRGYFHMSSEEVTETEPAEMVDMEETEMEAAEAEIQEPGMHEADQEESAAEIETETTAPAEEEIQEATEETVKEIEEAAELPPESISPAKKYHLIAGVFSERENAADRVEELKDEGFYADVVAVVNGRYYVSYNSFKKKSDARYEWQRLLDKGYEAWLYYY